MEEGRRLTNQEHIELWEEEHRQWTKARRRVRRMAMFAVAWSVCAGGFAIFVWGMSLALR